MNVSPASTLKETFSRLRLPKCCVLRNGLILNDSATFAFYDIKMNETLILLPEAIHTADLHEWITLTRDSTHFNTRVELVKNFEFRKSIARLKDLAEWNLDKRPRQFTARATTYQAWLDRTKPGNQMANRTTLTIEYDPPEEPISAALPSFW
jgi:hypothetical protein